MHGATIKIFNSIGLPVSQPYQRKLLFAYIGPFIIFTIKTSVFLKREE